MAVKTQTIDSWLITHANHQPDHPALHCPGHTHTYRQLAERVNALAIDLYTDMGLRRGDRIAFYGHNSDIEVMLLFAAAKLGLIVVPLNWRLAPAELNFIVGDCGAKVLLYGDEFSEQVAEVVVGLETLAVSAEEVKEGAVKSKDNPLPNPPKRRFEKRNVRFIKGGSLLSDPFLIVYTSGTTGQPKGAVVTQEAVFWNAVMSVHMHDLTADDHILNVLPLFHIGGINIQMLPCFFVGGTVSLPEGFDPVTVIETLETKGITTSVWVPTMCRALFAQPEWEQRAFPGLRLINTGSTDVPVDILESMNSRGIPMMQVYGATETGPVATYQRAGEAQETQGSIGRCGAHTQIRLVNDEGIDCKVGEPGEIWVRGPNNFSHYWNNQQATDEALVDGWFKTGDVAYQDESGLYWFTGRSKHVIISGGENIYPAELERIVNRLPGIVEAAVVGRADEKWGEVPVVVAVPDERGLTKQAVLGAFTGKVARFKQPKDVVFVEALPKNALGKVLIAEVRKLTVAT